MSVKPWNLFGNGRSALVKSCTSVVLMVNSLVLVLKSVPFTPMISPKSQLPTSRHKRLQEGYHEQTYNWILPLISCKVIKVALPIARRVIIRPATATSIRFIF